MVLKTDCGNELAELERSLSQSGYRVISWKEFSNWERQEGTSVRAAQKLGADAIFMINSLEENQAIEHTDSTESILIYRRSSPAGDDLGSVALDGADRKNIAAVFAALKKGNLRRPPAGATIDVSAVLANSGEAFWFYRRAVTDNIADVARKRILMRGRAGHFRPVLPVSVVEDEPAAPEFAEMDAELAVTSSIQDELAHRNLQLVRSVIADFVWRFTSGTRY